MKAGKVMGICAGTLCGVSIVWGAELQGGSSLPAFRERLEAAVSHYQAYETAQVIKNKDRDPSAYTMHR